MSTRIRIRRGLEANRLNVTPADGEPILISDTNQLYFGDGVTPGGIAISSSYSNLTGTNVMSSSAQLKYGLYGQDVVLGNITASNIQVTNLSVVTVTSSIFYTSGSHVFGNSLTDTHQFTGSLFVTGSVNNLFLNKNASGFSISGGTTSKTLTVSDNATINQSVATTSSPRFASLNVGAGAGAFLDQGGDSAAYLSGGAYYAGYSSDYLFKPVATQAQGILSESGQVVFWSNTGLTIGTNFSPTRRMVISTSGNVGINTGTTSPTARLEVVDTSVGLKISSANGSYKRILLFDNAASPTVKTWQIASQEISNGLHIGPSTTNGGTTFDKTGMFLTGTGNMGVGTSSPQRPLHLYTATGPNLRLETSGSNAALELVPGNGSGSIYNWVFGAQYNYGNEVEITPSSAAGGLTFSSANTVFRAAQSGTIRFPKYGAGTLVTDSSGNITTSSDARLKNIDGDFTRGLAELIKISPKLYHWNAKSGLDQKNQYAGFVAQDVQAAIPEAIGVGSDGMFTVQDRPLIAALINAIKELNSRISALESK